MIGNNTQNMDSPEDQRHTTNSSDSDRSSKTVEKYALRPRTIIKRLQQERSRQEVPKRPTRCKSRPAPLSKYRRKTANARERHRMKQINNAFESLRRILPDTAALQPASPSMTKIMTLRLAASYIRALSDVLEDEDVSDLYSLGGSLQNSIQNSLHQSLEHSIQLPLEKTLLPESSMVTLRYEDQISPFAQQYVTQVPLPLDYCSTSTITTTASNSSTSGVSRESLSSTSDLEDLLSDDSGLLEDNLHVFHDIPTFAADTFDVLL
ncbi:uncharacterized protein [Panulirus ornatus]|uniref:uncharacterized protein n=1 Tax=Panulirus ornatus TaxID=150431 RepID=UPI003A8446F6